MKVAHLFGLALGLALLFADIHIANAQTDPTWGGQVYYDLECGGNGSTAGGVNLPEDAVGWWRANSPAGGGVPYTDANVYRAADAGQEWIYEFDLQDDVTTVWLRMEAHQNTKVSITGPGNVDNANRQTFNNSSVVFQQAGMNHEPVSVDLTPYLSDPQVYNANRKIYLKFEGYNPGSGFQGGLVFHVRLDNGYPSFRVGANTNQYDDGAFIVPGAGGSANAAGGYRVADGGGYVIYKLKFLSGITSAFLGVRGEAQYLFSTGTATSGPWTQIGPSSLATGTNNLGTRVLDVSSMLNGTTNEFYLLMQDAASGDGNGNLWFALQATPTDPRTNFGATQPSNIYAEFEVGGDNANNNLTGNMPESYYSWFLANSSGINGVPYTNADVGRLVGNTYNWYYTYEFDLPDSVAHPTLRMHLGDNIKVEIADASGVSDANRGNFTGTEIYTRTALGSADVVAIDLEPYLTSNPTRKFYLRFSRSTAAGGADLGLLYHLRLDDGWPSFNAMPTNSRAGDENFILADTGSTADASGWREVSGGAYVIYKLDFTDDVTSAHVDAELAQGQQTLVSFGTTSGGPWSEPAPYATAVSGGHDVLTYDLSSYLTANATKTVYMLLRDANSADALPGTRLYSVRSGAGVPVELSNFAIE